MCFRKNGSFRGVHEQAGDADAAEIVNGKGQQAVDHAHGRDGFYAAAYTVNPARTQILAAESGHGDAGGFQRGSNNVVYPRPGGHRRHGHRAQTVHGALENDRAHGGDGKLQAHGHTDRGDIQHAAQVGPQMASVQPQQGHPGTHIDKAGNAGGCLGDNRGVCRPLHAHAEAGHEEYVQPNIYDDRGDEKQQGSAAVPKGAKYTGAEIVENGGAGAHEDYKYVGVCIIKDLSRGVHQAENIPGGEIGQRRQGQGEEYAQPHELPGPAFDLLLIPGAEALGNGDGKA